MVANISIRRPTFYFLFSLVDRKISRKVQYDVTTCIMSTPRMSDEELRALREVATRRRPHERYCTLCGIPSDFYQARQSHGIEDNHRDAYWASLRDPEILFDRGDHHDYLVWSSYFLARKSLRGWRSGFLTKI